jgi:hypothetical protein
LGPREFIENLDGSLDRREAGAKAQMAQCFLGEATARIYVAGREGRRNAPGWRTNFRMNRQTETNGHFLRPDPDFHILGRGVRKNREKARSMYQCAAESDDLCARSAAKQRLEDFGELERLLMENG